MSLSPFDKVCIFNKAFDYKVYPVHEGNALEMYPKDAKYRYNLIHEEGVIELGEALNKNDRVETMDGIADLLYVLYGACYTYDLNPDIMINTFYENYNEFYNRTKIDVFNCSLDSKDYYEILLKDIESVRLCLLEKKNINELYSVLIKTIINTFRLGFSLRININNIFDIVHNSNMSKLCSVEEEAKETVSFYESKYEMYINHYQNFCERFGKDSDEAKTIYSPYDSPYYYKSGDYYLVKNKSTGKALKSINYVPVIF
jgi:predicted HAD superfamily Cof-like phosphohydrolase